MKLIVFPHAGGFAAAYRFLKSASYSHIQEVLLYEYPGRGERFKEKPVKVFSDYIDQAVLDIMESGIANQNYLLFGHSMGAFIAYEVALRLQREYNLTPFLLIISGQNPPCTIDIKHYMMNEQEGMDFLLRLGGVPDIIKDNLEVSRYFLSLTVLDLKLLQTYQPTIPLAKERVERGIVLYGKSDIEVEATNLHMWNRHIKNLSKNEVFAGDHFYINDADNQNAIINLINKLVEKGVAQYDFL